MTLNHLLRCSCEPPVGSRSLTFVTVSHAMQRPSRNHWSALPRDILRSPKGSLHMASASGPALTNGNSSNGSSLSDLPPSERPTGILPDPARSGGLGGRGASSLDEEIAGRHGAVFLGVLDVFKVSSEPPQGGLGGSPEGAWSLPSPAAP